MAETGAALTRANAAPAAANVAQVTPRRPLETTIHASAYGVKADGVTDDTAALNAAIAAAACGSSPNWYFTEVVLPVGQIRITSPVICSNSHTALKFCIRGAGLDRTWICADFHTTDAAPQFTVSGGAVTGVTINAAGSGYPGNYDGDASVFIGSHIELADLSVVSSPSRAAASNGGTLTGGAANMIGIMDFQSVSAAGHSIWTETFWSGWL